MKELNNWILQNKLNCSLDGAVLSIEGFGKLLFIEAKNGKIIEADYSLILNDDEYDFLDENKDIENIVFQFGSRFYYCPVKNKKKNEYNEEVIIPNFNDFRNLGNYSSDFSDLDFTHLGIHTGYELLNGSGDAKAWLKKAKYYGYKSLGICERNTLAGSLSFQMQCSDAGIKSVLGETISIAYDYKEDKEFQNIYEVKIYVKNEIGWRNLLRISKQVNVDFAGFIPKENLFEFTDGLIFVFFRDSFLYDSIYKKVNFIAEVEEWRKHVKKSDLYFQIDFSEYTDDGLDIENLNRIKRYFDKFSKYIKPVYIEDSYYLEKIDSSVKGILNKVGGKNMPESDDQYFKSVDEIIEKNLSLFSDENGSIDLFFESISNTAEISDKCDYMIDIGNHKLPKYPVKNKLDFYNDLILEGFEEKVIKKFKGDPEKIELYLSRIEEENSVIVGADLIDYFLILWDIIKWSTEQGILVGPGRGSAGGSLVAYMLGIIEIDPIEYNLLFERFLNKTRVSGERAKSADSLPDIDVDFEGKRRQDVKRYIEQRFNFDNVCSIGTYARMKTKSAMKDFGRAKALDFSKVNFATKEIPDAIEFDWSDIFINALKSNELKGFVQSNSEMCELLKAPLGQPRSGSIHPSAVIIVPKEDANGNPMEVYDWMPVKKMDGQIVSEWEGKYIDRAGFLKEDILGIAQLDKFKYILDLIENNYGKRINLNTIKTKDKEVFEYFSKGWNEDVFQFGTAGLKMYSFRVKPKSVEDLISMNALFRPGPMDSNAHNDFIDFRRGKKKAIIDIGMEEVVKDTQGLYIYQEQVMQAMVVGSLTLSESDQVRTFMKKKDLKALAAFKDKFIKGYSAILKSRGYKKDCEKYADAVWEKLNAFSSYGFNRSHAAAYSLMGYWSQWLKVKYPLEFWTASLNFADTDEAIPNRISEIKKIKNGIKVVEADINKSDIVFTSDTESNEIYWSLTKIKFVGDVAVSIIIDERNNGEFFSLEDFIQRVPKSKVNKKVIMNLIIVGAFDRISSEKLPTNGKEKINAKQRYDLLKIFLDSRNEAMPDEIENSPNKNQPWFWRLKQKELTGFGDINYKQLLKKTDWGDNKSLMKQYLDGDLVNEYIFDDVNYRKTVVAGRIMFIKVRPSKRGDYATISIEHNNSVVIVQLWNDCWSNKKIQSKLLELEQSKTMFAISGEIKYDTWKNKNVFFGDDKTKIIDL